VNPECWSLRMPEKGMTRRQEHIEIFQTGAALCIW